MSRLESTTSPQPATATAPRCALLTVDQVADYWGVSVSTVRRWISQGELEAVRSPGRGAVRVPSSAVPGWEE